MKKIYIHTINIENRIKEKGYNKTQLAEILNKKYGFTNSRFRIIRLLNPNNDEMSPSFFYIVALSEILEIPIQSFFYVVNNDAISNSIAQEGGG